MNPPDLPNAMVIVQELDSNNMRAHFANSFSTTQRKIVSQTLVEMLKHISTTSQDNKTTITITSATIII